VSQAQAGSSAVRLHKAVNAKRWSEPAACELGYGISLALAFEFVRATMVDVVIRLPIKSDQEANLFSTYLNRFMQRRSAVVDDLPEAIDAPYLIVHTDPRLDRELKVLTFQNLGAARAFSSGWERARGALDGEIA
jgi:hypothetical protein